MRFALLFLTLLLATSVTGQAEERDPAVCPPSLQRPCIALVLGGGGARGGAHIGVLRYLEEQRIPIDLIVGTSVGSFVGGLYASGKSADEIEEMFRSADWNLGYQDDVPRSQIPIRRQRQKDNFPIQLDLGVGLDGVSLPQGFLQGQGMRELVDSLLGAFPRLESFNDLAIPFRAVSADIESGNEVVLASGDLAQAMQASMSIPGLVRPTEIDGRLLVDGGIANNLPISVAKELGADTVIAVDIGSPSIGRDDLGSGVAIIHQLASFLTHKNVNYQKSLLSDNDVLVHPSLENVTLLSFDKVLDGIPPGYEAAQAQLAGRQFPRSNQTLAQHVGERALKEFHIENIVLNNQSGLADDYVLHRLGFEVGQNYTVQDLLVGTERLYGQGTIARIDTALSETPGGEALHIDVREKEWGPGFMDFKLAFEDNFDTVSRYQVGASYRLTNLSPYGAEWFSAGEFGTNKSLLTELYWPLKTSGFYAEVSASTDREVFQYIDDDYFPQGELVTKEFASYGGLGWDAIDQLDIFLAARHTDGQLKFPNAITEEIGVARVDYRQDGVYLRLNYDSLDDISFPRRGWKLSSTVYRTRDKALGDSALNTIADLDLNGVVSLGAHSLRGQLSMSSVYEDDTSILIGLSALGGFLNLSGNPTDAIIGNHVRFGSLVYTYQLAANDFGAINLPLYLGLSAEAGNAWDERGKVDYSDLIHSGSIFLGWDSPLGPAYLAYGQSDTGQRSFYAYLGLLF